MSHPLAQETKLASVIPAIAAKQVVQGQLEAFAKRQWPVHCVGGEPCCFATCQTLQDPKPFKSTSQHLRHLNLPENRLASSSRRGTLSGFFSRRSARDVWRRFIHSIVVSLGGTLQTPGKELSVDDDVSLKERRLQFLPLLEPGVSCGKPSLTASPETEKTKIYS